MKSQLIANIVAECCSKYRTSTFEYKNNSLSFVVQGKNIAQFDRLRRSIRKALQKYNNSWVAVPEEYNKTWRGFLTTPTYDGKMRHTIVVHF